MNKNDLFNAIGELDDDIIERSELSKSYKRPVFTRIIAIAACLCILSSVIAVGLISKFRSENNNSDSESFSEDHSQERDIGKPTSYKYKTLDELLADISKNDNHSDTMGSGVSTSSDSDGIDYFTRVCLRGEYELRIINMYQKNSQLRICKKDDDGYYSNYIRDDIDAKSFMLHNDILITSLNKSLRFYNITDMSNPSFITEYTFERSVSVYRCDNELYVTFSDGVCACGWSRTDAMSEFYPGYSRDGQTEKWGDDYISILGAPTRVSYIAVMKISLETFEVIDKRAYYGDIEEFNYGLDWFAITTQTRKMADGYVLNPDVYTFDTTNALKHMGKIDLSKHFNREKKVMLYQKMFAKDINIKSVSKIDGKFRIIAYENIRDPKPGVNRYRVLMAMEADMTNGRYVSGEFTIEHNNPWFNQRLNEKGRTILTVSYADSQETKYVDTFIFIEFSDKRVKFIPSNLIAEYVDGIKNRYAGGITEAIVPMGNGIYIRYNSTPNGWDVYDFSDSKNPKHLHKSTPLIGEDDFNTYSWIKYSENLFGVARCTPDEDAPGSSSRECDIYWDFYSFDPNSETPFTLIESRKVFGYTTAYRFAIKNFDEKYYLVYENNISYESVMP